MKDLQVTTDPVVEQVFEQYPAHVKAKMAVLRNLVLETAWELDGLDQLEETL